MSVIDLFSFNGEFDILELRLNILDKAVDQFIICEGDETTAGNTKPRYFEENKERYAKWLPKIKYHIMSPYTDPALSLLADTSPGVPKDMHWWRREFIQKESMRYALTHLRDEDRVFIGDADEIWNPDITFPEGRWELQQTVYTYYLNNRSTEYWTGTSLMSYKDIKTDTLDNLRAYDQHRAHMLAPVYPNAGWHFTNIGGAEFVKRKIQSYAHQEFNNPAMLNTIEARIANNQDYLGRDFVLGKDETGLPQYLLENKEEVRSSIQRIEKKSTRLQRQRGGQSPIRDIDQLMLA
jgi:beta-1,4-mannosyl-glycoprotein beta-1,4-N-acetylglucosaminyltransferase